MAKPQQRTKQKRKPSSVKAVSKKRQSQNRWLKL